MIGLRSSSHSLPFLPSQQEGRRSGWVLGAGLLVSSRGIFWISPRFGDIHIGLRAKEGSRENASPLSQQFLPGDGAPYCCLLASLFLFTHTPHWCQCEGWLRRGSPFPDGWIGQLVMCFLSSTQFISFESKLPSGSWGSPQFLCAFILKLSNTPHIDCVCGR